MRSPLRSPPRRRRAGSTLVELTLAVMILGVGVLALAGSIGVTARADDDAWRLSTAVRAARDRLERLMLAPCAAPSAGDTTVAGALSVRWRVAGEGPRRSLEVVAAIVTRAGARTVALAGSVACDA